MAYAAAGCTGSSKAATLKNGGLNEDRFQISQLSIGHDHGALYLGVFDGHGGPGASSYLFEHFLTHFETSMKNGAEKGLEHILHDCFMRSDHMLYQDVQRLGKEYQHLRDERCTCSFYRESPCRCLRAPRSAHEGSTGTVVLYTNERLYCANVGDSEAMLVTKSGYIRSTNEGGGREFDSPGTRSALNIPCKPPQPPPQTSNTTTTDTEKTFHASTASSSSSTSINATITGGGGGGGQVAKSVATTEKGTNENSNGTNSMMEESGDTPPTSAGGGGGGNNRETNSNDSNIDNEEIGTGMEQDTIMKTASDNSPEQILIKSLDNSDDKMDTTSSPLMSSSACSTPERNPPNDAMNNDNSSNNAGTNGIPKSNDSPSSSSTVHMNLTDLGGGGGDDRKENTSVGEMLARRHVETKPHFVTRKVELGSSTSCANLNAETLTIADTPIPDLLNADYIRVKNIAEHRVRRKVSKSRSGRTDGIRRGPSHRFNYVALEGAHSLNMTRAFGNYGHKVFKETDFIEAESPITARPHVNMFEAAFENDFLFLVVASDGLWDNLAKEEVATIVKDHVRNGYRNYKRGTAARPSRSSNAIANKSTVSGLSQQEGKVDIAKDEAFLSNLAESSSEELLSKALTRNRKLDDITVVVVLFHNILFAARDNEL